MTAKRKKASNTDAKKKERASTTRKKGLLLEALRLNLGNITEACKAAGVARCSFYDWRDSDQAFASAVDEIAEEQIDLVEGALLGRIKGGDTTAMIFYLKTKGRGRGFSERLELTGREGKDLFGQSSDDELDDKIKELTRKLGDGR